MSALPLEEAGRYVAAAYVAFMVLVVLYVVIIAAKVSRMERELEGLKKPAEDSRR
jgi:type II secretory pathway component PulM